MPVHFGFYVVSGKKDHMKNTRDESARGPSAVLQFSSPGKCPVSGHHLASGKYLGPPYFTEISALGSYCSRRTYRGKTFRKWELARYFNCRKTVTLTSQSLK